jgi:23S rRNA pseudouridine1911/1915/1917 synthase
MSLGPRILHEDEHCLAVVKRAGQFVQGDWAPPGERTLEQEVREHLRPDDPSAAFVGIVHRLDQPVSGVLLWAKTTRAARRLSALFEARRVEKEYWAVVESRGTTPSPEGLWTDWLTRPDRSGVVCAVEPGTAGSRPAATRYRRERAVLLPEACLWLTLFPETGRTHQLRIQAARRGWPILGDASYGARSSFEPGIALHARRLRLPHPTTQRPLELVAPLPDGWAEQGIELPADGAT